MEHIFEPKKNRTGNHVHGRRCWGATASAHGVHAPWAVAVVQQARARSESHTGPQRAVYAQIKSRRPASSNSWNSEKRWDSIQVSEKDRPHEQLRLGCRSRHSSNARPLRPEVARTLGCSGANFVGELWLTSRAHPARLSAPLIVARVSARDYQRGAPEAAYSASVGVEKEMGGVNSSFREK
jgi:hypothetical protein